MRLKAENITGRAVIGAVAVAVVIALLISRFASDASPTSVLPAGTAGWAVKLPADTTQLAMGGYGIAPVQQSTPVATKRKPVVNDLTAGAADSAGGQEAKNYVAPDIRLSEAHWQGMDTTQLDQELRRTLKYPKGLQGILIDEVTLNAAKSGLNAGDVIVAVEGVPVTTLQGFQAQTKVLRNRQHAALSTLRKSNKVKDGRFTMNRFDFVLRADSVLGFAQVESAPMILAGDPRPHPYRGACTLCHAIGSGFELTPDPDLITLPPPPITKAAITEGLSPHRDRGPCVACHVVSP